MAILIEQVKPFEDGYIINVRIHTACCKKSFRVFHKDGDIPMCVETCQEVGGHTKQLVEDAVLAYKKQHETKC